MTCNFALSTKQFFAPNTILNSILYRAAMGVTILHLYQHGHAHSSLLDYYVNQQAATVNAVVLVVQRFGVGLMIKRSLVRLPAGALSSQLGQLSLPSLRGR